MSKRQSNHPERRLAPITELSTDLLADFARRARYGGSNHHKLKPGDYGFTPPISPRPSKSVCDDRRIILRAEAHSLFERALSSGMVGVFALGMLPKYVWAVSDDMEVYEAKTKPGSEDPYHGYRLGDDEAAMRGYILTAWKERCTKPWK